MYLKKWFRVSIRRLTWSMSGYLERTTKLVVGKAAPVFVSFCLDTLGIFGYRWFRDLSIILLKINVSKTIKFFDGNFYISQVEKKGLKRIAAYDPHLHYHLVGWMFGLSPHPHFNPGVYRNENPGLRWYQNPLVHYANNFKTASESDSLPLYNSSVSSIYEQTSSTHNTTLTYVVYTALIGGYDELLPPPPSGLCKYIAFTDLPVTIPGWEVRPLTYFHYDPTRAARFVKLHPHILLPEFDYSIWVDANIVITKELSPLFDRLSADTHISTFVHPQRECIYDEGKECIKRLKDSSATITSQLDRYYRMRFPAKAGLWETNVLVRRHHHPDCVSVMAAWWAEMENGSKRDQLSLPVVLNKLGASLAPLDNHGRSARKHPMLGLQPHVKQHRPANINFGYGKNRPNEIDVDQLTVTVGVCVHNALEETKACLESLVESRTKNTVIMIVDDGSSEPTRLFLQKFASQNIGIELLRNDSALGYTKSANIVLRNSTADWIILANSDTITPRRALKKILQCGSQNPRIGVVGPLSNAAGWQTVPVRNNRAGFVVNKLPRGLSVEHMDAICEDVGLGLVPLVPLVNGFFFAIRGSVLSIVGSFDELSFPIGYGEEDDFCFRVANAGYTCAIDTNTYVFHAKSASFTSRGRQKLLVNAERQLREKHGLTRVQVAGHTMRQNIALAEMRSRIETTIDARSV